MCLLSSYDNNDKKDFCWFVPPRSSNIILGMCLDSNYIGKFNLSGKYASITKKPKNFKEDNIDVRKFANKDVADEYNGLDSYYSFISFPTEKAIEMLAFTQLNLENEDPKYIKGKYPEIIRLLNELFGFDESKYWVEVYYADVIYVGQVNEKKIREGVGAVIFQDRDCIICGEYKDGELNGKGVVFNKSLRDKYYEGSFANGEKNGNGALLLPNGDQYEGEFKNGKFNGQGTYYFRDGRTLTGKFKDSVLDGEGMLTGYNGTKNIRFVPGVQTK